MNLRLHRRQTTGAVWRPLGLLVALAALLGSCRHETVAVPNDAEYYPVAVGTYRTYAVVDSAWASGKVTVSQYQVRERVSEQFADAAGQPAYRLVRSRRVSASAAWADDSALVVQPLPRAVLLTKGNVRTVELLLPPQAGKSWNRTAFTVNGQAGIYSDVVDTITTLNRHYGPAVNAAYTVPAAAGAPAKTYDATLTVADIQPVGLNDRLLRQSGYQQVFARGTGPVLRRRYYYETFTKASNGAETVTPGVVQNGTSRRETLLETGKL